LTGAVSDQRGLSRIQEETKSLLFPVPGVIREFIFKKLKTKDYKGLNRCKKDQKQGNS
jgi:hypothetical protein